MLEMNVQEFNLRNITTPRLVLYLLSAVLIGLFAVSQPLSVTILVTGLITFLVLYTYRSNIPRWALNLLLFSLTGYALLGRGFAYLGVPPLFIGEVTLVLGLLALPRLGRWQLRHTPVIVALLCLYLLVQLNATLPYIGRYGLDAVRDAALWYYALFAIITAQLVLHFQAFDSLLQRYVRFIPYLLLFIPLILLASRVLPAGALPVWPGTGTPILAVKGGDMAVHLSGILAFLLLGLNHFYTQRRNEVNSPFSPVVATEVASRSPALDLRLWAVWLLAALSTFTGRAAMLSVLVAGLVTVMFRPASRWGRPLYLLVLVLMLFLTFNFRVSVGTWDKREISVEGLITTLRSVTSNTNSIRDQTRAWRLQWWDKIVNYTVHGPYFWTGKGYGINLADSDGFQVQADGSLRSPHNGHINILARSGVPGFSTWVLLQLAFGAALLKAHWRARANGRQREANLFLWIFAYWLAFLVNASFDVYLEGPQGGIWFWSLFGFGLAALELERRAFAAQSGLALPAPRRAETPES